MEANISLLPLQLCGTLLTLTTTHLLTLRLRTQTANLSQSIRETTLIADSILLPRATIQPARARITRPSFTETLKDTWNKEVEGLVRGVQQRGANNASGVASGSGTGVAVWEKLERAMGGWVGGEKEKGKGGN